MFKINVQVRISNDIIKFGEERGTVLLLFACIVYICYVYWSLGDDVYHKPV